MVIQLNPVSAREHVPEIVHYIHTVKEQTHSSYNTVPFKQMSDIVIVEMVAMSILWLNSFPLAGSNDDDPNYDPANDSGTDSNDDSNPGESDDVDDDDGPRLEIQETTGSDVTTSNEDSDDDNSTHLDHDPPMMLPLQ
jgi:hypothetical protein